MTNHSGALFQLRHADGSTVRLAVIDDPGKIAARVHVLVRTFRD